MLALLLIGLAAATGAATAQPTAEERAAAAVDAIADAWYRERLERFPELPYLAGSEAPRHDRLQDNRLEALREWHALEDGWQRELERIDPEILQGRPQWISFGLLREELESSIGLRACRQELWGVNQMSGWQLLYPRIAELQPVGDAALREQALTRWGRLPQFVRTEIDNLRSGLKLGYSSPKSNVRLVIEQFDGLLGLAIEESPFYSPAARDPDAEFAAAMHALVADGINPALLEYRRFLADEYLPQARAALAVSALPDGERCYRASLRSYTTLDRSPQEVYQLGRRTVAEHRRVVVDLGHRLYGLGNFAAIIEETKLNPRDRFASSDELLAYSRATVERAGEAVSDWFGTVPSQPVIVEPYPAYQDGTGVSSRYEPAEPASPGIYRITLFEPGMQTRASAEITAVHETWPGHHLQIAIAQNIDGLHPMTRLVFNSGFVEGWARYAEALAEEMAIYRAPAAPISRRAWPARGMVVDPGLHLFGWSREQAVDYMVESGHFTPARAEQMVDRIAILPGQLTAYDSGALEILALRRAAESTLRLNFDLPAFHDRVLEHGAVPLWMLREHVERWIAGERRRRPAKADADLPAAIAR